MLAKMAAKNQLTLPETVTDAVGATEYFDVETRNGHVAGRADFLVTGDADLGTAAVSTRH